MKLIVVGELNVDLILRGYSIFPALGKEVLVDDLALTLGSSSAICAVGLARLGNAVSFLGKVGRDVWGDFCLETLRNAGIDTEPVIRDASLKTGLTASVSSASDRALITYLGAISELRPSDVPETALEGKRHLHISSFFLQQGLRAGLSALFQAAHRNGLTTSLDPGYDPLETWDRSLLEALEEVDIFLPNESEIRAISGSDDIEEALRRLDNGRTLTVAKLGAAGAMSMQSGAVVQVDGFPVSPVDTTGAGDSFNAGFLHAWLQSYPLREALQFGCACGAMSTLGVGGTGAQASEKDAHEFLRARGVTLLGAPQPAR
jgi:sugar/nucleoside kinase (ribokinase family)